MVFGQPKSGKSNLMLEFAHHLAREHGEVLYCAIEEGFGYTLQEKVGRLVLPLVYRCHSKVEILV